MADTYILAHDIGTSGVKTSIIKHDGTVLGSQTHSHSTLAAAPGMAEQNAEDWWTGVCRNTRTLIELNPGIENKIAVIGVSGIMLGCLPVDSKGKALGKCLIHSDSRARLQHERLIQAFDARELYGITGNIADPKSSLCKVMWIKDHEPWIYKNTARFLQSKDYITACLTGNIDITDYSDASHTQLMDIAGKKYAEGIMSFLELDRSKFPEIYKSTDIVGKLTKDSAKLLGLPDGIPVIAGGGDGACANAGAGVTVPGETYCCLGTTAWIARISERPVIDPGQRIFNILALDGDNYGVFGTIQAACKSVQWIMGVFGEKDPKEYDRTAELAPAGCEGMIYLPYIDGERSPVFDANARGVFYGMSSVHEKKHFMRAGLEGVAYALRNVLDIFRETADVELMRIIGGGAGSRFWRKIISDICSIDIESTGISSEYATSMGVAAAASVAAGIFPSISEAVSGIGISDRICPDKAIAPFYNRMYEVYAKLYPALKMAFRMSVCINREFGRDGNE